MRKTERRMRLRGKASRAGKWKLLQKHEAILFSKKKKKKHEAIFVESRAVAFKD